MTKYEKRIKENYAGYAWYGVPDVAMLHGGQDVATIRENKAANRYKKYIKRIRDNKRRNMQEAVDGTI